MTLLGEAELIDLTVTIAEELPGVWPSHMPFQQKVWNWFVPESDTTAGQSVRSIAPYQTRWSILDDHAGTHVDAPSHWIPPSKSGLPGAGPAGDMTGEKIPPASLIGPAAVIDCTGLLNEGEPGRSPLIKVETIVAWEEQHGAIARGDIVLFSTGWDRYYRAGREGNLYAREPLIRRKRPAWPAPSPAVVHALHERGVMTIGTDGASMGAAHDTESAHVAGLSREMLFIEALCRLGELPARGSLFFFLPIKIAGASGEPWRAIAFVPRS